MVHLLLGDLHLLERRRDVLEGEVALLLAERDEPVQLVDLVQDALASLEISPQLRSLPLGFCLLCTERLLALEQSGMLLVLPR